MERRNIDGKDFFVDAYRQPIEVGDVLQQVSYSSLNTTICVKTTKTTIYTLTVKWGWDRNTKKHFTEVAEKRANKWGNFINCTKLDKEVEIPASILTYYQENYLKS